VTKQAEDILTQLRALAPELDRFKARRLKLFGSFARGEALEQSDVDLLVEFAPGAGLFDLVGLGDFLEDKLSRYVDLVPENALRIELKERVMKEAIAL
jgi:hypothetical protein